MNLNKIEVNPLAFRRLLLLLLIFFWGPSFAAERHPSGRDKEDGLREKLDSRLNDGHRRKLVEASSPSSTVPNQYLVQFHDSVLNVESAAFMLLRSFERELKFASATHTTDNNTNTTSLDSTFSFPISASQSLPSSVFQKIPAKPVLPKILHVYQVVWKGFAVQHGGPLFITRILQSSLVRAVYQDQTMSVAYVEQRVPPSWGLDRLDQVKLPLNYLYRYSYTGRGVQVYIVDTGIRASHVEFRYPQKGGGINQTFRVVCGTGTSFGTCTDGYGHGTHVAGTVGGLTYGVAKNVELITVKVLNDQGGGTYADLVAGLDYVASRKKANPSQAMVINMSLSGDYNNAVNNAVQTATSLGVIVVVAAGNANANACLYSPGTVASAITVAAVDTTDTRASFSNWGPCVDIFAPGVAITSTWYTSDTAFQTLSGTSMATPHVTGVVALLLESAPDNLMDPTTWVVNELFNISSANIVKGSLSNSPNRLSHMGYLTSLGPASEYPSPQPHVAPSHSPSSRPSRWPSRKPSEHPSRTPVFTSAPSQHPSYRPSLRPTWFPSEVPQIAPSLQPTGHPKSCSRLWSRCQLSSQCCRGRCHSRLQRCFF